MSEVVTVAVVDRDHINKDDPEFIRIGKKFQVYRSHFNTLFPTRADESYPSNIQELKTRWRAKDDDGVICYGGWLYNDQDAEVQYEVLKWAMSDAGCTIIEIKENDAWRQEIG